jgi:hypothetical protein
VGCRVEESSDPAITPDRSRLPRARRKILGWTPQYVARLAVQGRLPWLLTDLSAGAPTRVYRRAQIEVIATARSKVIGAWLN